MKNPVVYLAIVGLEYEWSLKPLASVDADATRLRDFALENRHAARDIRTQIAIGKTSGKVRIVP